jgi:hypothetical protein
MELIRHPGRFPDTALCLGYIKIISVNKAGAVGMDDNENQYELLIDSRKLTVNELYSMRGFVRADGKFFVEVFQHHPFRELKYVFSGLSLFLILYIIKVYIRFDSASRSFRVMNTEKGLFGISAKGGP